MLRSYWVAALVLVVPTVAGAQTPKAVKSGFVARRSPVPGAPAGVTAFVNVSVVPMDTARVLRAQTVLVQHGWITALGPNGKVAVPAGATRIDGTGKYLIPGLADMHVHLGYLYEDSADAATAERRLFLYAANGVTTVRNMDWSWTGERALQLKSRAAAGTLWGPRIYTAGALMAGGYDPKVKPAELAQYVAAYKAAGYDFIKIRTTPDSSLVAAARQAGLPLAGHVNGPTDRFLASGVASIEHLMYDDAIAPDHDSASVWSYTMHANAVRARVLSGADSAILLRQRQRIDFAKIPALAAATQRAGVWNTPTQAIYELSTLEQKFQGPPAFPDLRYAWPARQGEWSVMPMYMSSMGSNLVAEISGILEFRRQLIKALQDAGAGLLLGTDVPLTYLMPGFAVHRELDALVRAGLTPYQALATGTRNVAAFFNTLDSTGTVTVNKRADLVLLQGNPLDDIGHTKQPAGVMLGGRWLPWAEIARRLATRTPAEQQAVDDFYLRVALSTMPALTKAQQAALQSLRTVYQAGMRALADSVGPAEPIPAHTQRALGVSVRRFAAYREVLAPPQRAVFDTQVAAWRAELVREGYRVPGLGVKP